MLRLYRIQAAVLVLLSAACAHPVRKAATDRAPAAVDVLEETKISPELLTALTQDFSSAILTVPKPRRVYTWLTADGLIGNESTYASTEARLIQRFSLFADQFWGSETNTYSSGMAGLGLYVTIDPVYSSNYGYDAKKLDQWILGSVLLPVGTRLLDLRRVSYSDQTSRWLRNELSCKTGEYREMLKERDCYSAFRQVFRKLQVSGVVYTWNNNEWHLCSRDKIAIVLFNRALYSTTSVRHFRQIHQGHWSDGTLAEEVKTEMPMLDRAFRDIQSTALWPTLEGVLGPKMQPDTVFEKAKSSTVLGCSDAWESMNKNPGNLTIPAFPLTASSQKRAPLVPISGVYSGIAVLQATWGGNFPGKTKVSKLNQVVSACQGKRECDFTVDFESLGDPSPGITKLFRILYRCGTGQTNHEAVTEGDASGQTLSLSCGTKGVITIASANILPQYGSIEPGNVTEEVQKFLGDKLEARYRISSDHLSDPLPGYPKSFELEYACPKDPTDLKRVFFPADAEGKEFDIKCAAQ